MLDMMRITNLIKGAGHTEYSICKALKWGNGAISRWSKNVPGIDKLVMLSNLINVPVYELLGDIAGLPIEHAAPYVSPEEFAIIDKLRALPPEKHKLAVDLLNQL